MWHDHPLGQRGWGLVATGEGGWTKFEKGGIGNAGGLHKIRGSGAYCQLC